MWDRLHFLASNALAIGLATTPYIAALVAVIGLLASIFFLYLAFTLKSAAMMARRTRLEVNETFSIKEANVVSDRRVNIGLIRLFLAAIFSIFSSGLIIYVMYLSISHASHRSFLGYYVASFAALSFIANIYASVKELHDDISSMSSDLDRIKISLDEAQSRLRKRGGS